MNPEKYKHFSINRWKQGLSWGFTFALSFILGIYLVIAGGYTWRGDYSIHVANLVIGGLFIGGYLTWRMLKNRARLPRTGLELIILITFSIAILSWLLSPDPRQGVSRLMLFALYIISFYLFLDLFDAGLNKTAAFHGLLMAGGLVILLAVYEVYQQYHAWWQTVGSFNILPPGPYRLTSILGHSNALMPYINPLAPMALVAFILARRPLGKVVYAVWLLLYLIMLPFTSSRGGWVGFLAWLGILILYWIWKAGFQRLRQLLWTKRLPGTRVLFIIAGGIIGLAALKGWSYFSSHSSHGSPGANLFATRTGIWANAIAVIKSNPLIGIGPGRFAFGYLAQGHDAPPGFWAMHAHDLPLELAAEFGLFGLLAVVILLLVGGYKVWKILQNSSRSEPDLWSIAAMAGIASFLVNCIIEDPTRVVPSMIMLVFLMAFILATTSTLNLPNALPRFRNLGLGILWVPGLIILGLEGWMTWAYQPMTAGLAAAQNKDWVKTATLISQSSARDPSFTFYQTDAGLAWSRAWLSSGDPQALQKARLYLEKSLETEPSVSLLWADLAVLHWYGGDRPSAFDAIRQAIRISPLEPSYHLNLAWFEEQTGENQLATIDYQKVLDLSPSWSTHPFFLKTSLRRLALEAWKKQNQALIDQAQSALTSTYWYQANQALKQKDMKAVDRWAAASVWEAEAPMPQLITLGNIAQARGDLKGAAWMYQTAANRSMNNNLITSSYFVYAYNLWINDRSGLGIDLVPGYLQLQPDVDQLRAFEQLESWYIQNGQCEQAKQTWNAIKIYQNGGVLENGSDLPACTEK